MIGILESDYPRDMIERMIQDRLTKRLFKLWWEGGDYLDALELIRSL